MSTVAMSGNDALTLQNRILSDFADGDWGSITYSGDIAAVKTGKNNNTIYSQNNTGLNCQMTLRLIRASADDKWMNGLLAQQNANFAGFVLLFGQFIKRVGDGKGTITNDTYTLTGGVFQKMVEGKSNAEGDTEQSVSIYNLSFALAPRAIG